MSATPHRNRGPKRFALVVFGLFLAVGTAELGLWLASQTVASDTEDYTVPEGKVRILAWGDSFTYGLGAADGRGYPEHLQSLLDEAWGPGEAALVNGGIPGQNSSQAADRLPAALAAVQPDILILMVGHNNTWNFNGLHVDTARASGRLRMAQLLGASRVVKLLQIALRWELGASATGTTAPDAEAWYAEQRKREKQHKLTTEKAELTAVLENNPQDIYALVKLSLLAESVGDREQARLLTDRARRIDAAEVDRIASDQRRIEAWHDAQRKRGDDADLSRSPEARARVYAALEARGDTQDQQGLLDDVLVSDLTTMTQAAQAAGVQVVVTGYASATKTATPVLRGFAEGNSLPFFDHQADFDAAIQGGAPMSAWFVLDGHCTSEGYARMASNLVPLLTALQTPGG